MPIDLSFIHILPCKYFPNLHIWSYDNSVLYYQAISSFECQLLKYNIYVCKVILCQTLYIFSSEVVIQYEQMWYFLHQYHNCLKNLLNLEVALSSNQRSKNQNHPLDHVHYNYSKNRWRHTYIITSGFSIFSKVDIILSQVSEFSDSLNIIFSSSIIIYW